MFHHSSERLEGFAMILILLMPPSGNIFTLQHHYIIITTIIKCIPYLTCVTAWSPGVARWPWARLKVCTWCGLSLEGGSRGRHLQEPDTTS